MARNTIQNDEELRVFTNKEIIIRLLRYLKEYKPKVTVVILLLMFVMGCDLFNPYVLKITIDNYIKRSDIKGLIIIGSLTILLNVFSMVASRMRVKLMAEIVNSILVNIRNELYTHIQKLSFSFFDNRPVGKVLARVIGDVNSLQDLFTNSITSLIPDFAKLVCVAVIMFVMNYKLALAAISILPFLIFGLFTIETISRKRWQVFRKRTSNLNAYTHENFSGIKVTQEFVNEEKNSKAFLTMVTDLMDQFMHAVKLNDLFWPLVEFSWGMGSVVLFAWSVSLIHTGDVTVGTLIAFTTYITMFWQPIMNLSNFYNNLVTNLAAGERIFEILDIQPDIVDKGDSKEMPAIKGNVKFDHVEFSYDEGVKVLDDISFNIKGGERVALVGPTGAGKTTIVNLISRFYDVTKGQVLIDDTDIRNVTLESLRSQMGIMLQDTFLFSTTIMENIRYGKLNATDEEVIAAAKAVNAHEFIMKFKDGYQTEVNERGSRLSVGQRQLISFARALLADPRILILDEATSNIDTFTERIVQKGIEKLLHGRTSFVIAHRLSTIRDCDRIMVIDDGKITEQGSHDELIRLKGKYYDLYMSQYKFLSEGA